MTDKTITEQIASGINSLSEQAQSAANSVLGTSAEARQKVNKEQALHGNSLGEQVDGATGYLGATKDRAEAKAKEEYHDKNADAQ